MLGNPWLEESGELYELDGSIIMPPEVIENIRRIKDIGKAKYDSFVKLRIESQQDSFTSTLSQTNLKLFKDEMEKKKAAMSDKALICDIKSQQAKVVDIMLAHQAGRIITEAVLSHESSEYPPSFTRKGLMHQTTKSDILECIAPPVVCTRDAPATTCTILDGSVLVQQLRPETSITIKDYVDTVFGPHILRYFNNHQRVDVVFDTYSSESIKCGTREKRGEGKIRKVNSETKVPGNWQDFLRVSQNKEELFKVISERLLEQLKLPPVRHKHFK